MTPDEIQRVFTIHVSPIASFLNIRVSSPDLVTTIAVVGQRFTGKSSFVNALAGTTAVVAGSNEKVTIIRGDPELNELTLKYSPQLPSYLTIVNVSGLDHEIEADVVFFFLDATGDESVLQEFASIAGKKVLVLEKLDAFADELTRLKVVAGISRTLGRLNEEAEIFCLCDGRPYDEKLALLDLVRCSRNSKIAQARAQLLIDMRLLLKNIDQLLHRDERAETCIRTAKSFASVLVRTAMISQIIAILVLTLVENEFWKYPVVGVAVLVSVALICVAWFVKKLRFGIMDVAKKEKMLEHKTLLNKRINIEY